MGARPESSVLFLGAGASRPFGIPMTAEILPHILGSRPPRTPCFTDPAPARRRQRGPRARGPAHRPRAARPRPVPENVEPPLITATPSSRWSTSCSRRVTPEGPACRRPSSTGCARCSSRPRRRCWWARPRMTTARRRATAPCSTRSWTGSKPRPRRRARGSRSSPPTTTWCCSRRCSSGWAPAASTSGSTSAWPGATPTGRRARAHARPRRGSASSSCTARWTGCAARCAATCPSRPGRRSSATGTSSKAAAAAPARAATARCAT